MSRAVWAWIARAGRRPVVAAALCAAVSLAGSVPYSILVKWPEPHIHDEYSYLLAADTFRNGRLANPPHPLGEFFETFHVLQRPTYASKYPPAQGILLAAGWILGGHPVAGVWAGGALMAIALWWMLRGFLPPRWALLGGLLASAHLATTGYWTQSYWGGCVPAIGGALLAGSLPRMARLGRPRDAVAFAGGLAVLASSRPYEGLLVAVPAGVVFVAVLVRRWRAGGARAAGPLAAPAAALMLLTFAWIGVYDRAVTGSPFRLPYAEHDTQYAVAPPMLWLPLGTPPAYRHDTLRQFWAGVNVADHAQQQTASAFFAASRHKLLALWKFYLGQFLSVGLLALPCALRRRWTGFALFNVVLILAAALGQSHGEQPHYASVATAWSVLLVTAGLREITSWRPRGAAVGAALVLVLAALVLARPAVRIARTPKFVYDWRRSQLVAELESDGARHLVIVRYGPCHSCFAELVWNAAKIDESSVVWARDMGAEKNRELLEYYPDRQAWLLEVDFPGAPMKRTRYAR
jgi:hypothetical protein